MYKMNLEHINLPESKESIKDFWSHAQRIGANLKGLSLCEDGNLGHQKE